MSPELVRIMEQMWEDHEDAFIILFEEEDRLKSGDRGNDSRPSSAAPT